MRRDEILDQRDARYWRTLVNYFKVDHIWYNVLGAPEGYRTVEDVLDAVDEHKTTEILFK